MKVHGAAVVVSVAMLAIGTLGPGACGGIAVIDAVGQGGGGGAVASSGPSTSTSTSTSSGVGGGPGGLCEEACALMDGCLSTDFCPELCNLASGGCQTAQDAWLQCVIGAGVGCMGTVPCEVELDAFLECSGVSPGGPFGCSVGGEDCFCDSQGANGIIYSTECEGNVCNCLIDGTFAGTCGGSGPPSCDPWFGCCGAVFFVAGP